MPFVGNFGPTELIIILVIALVVLGPGKLPEVGQALGKSIREFRKAATDVKEATSLEPAKPTTSPATPPTPAPTETVMTPPAAVPPAASTSSDPDQPVA